MAEAEECVLGIPIADPEVLKATQFVLVSVGISAFFLVLELSQVAEQRGLTGLNRTEVAFWCLDTTRAVAITLSGYFGVKRSNRALLGCFCGISCLSAALSLGLAVRDSAVGAKAGTVALRAFAALFFSLGGYASFHLFRRAGEGALIGQPGSGKSSYVLLGIPMMDLQVLKATQGVFTSLGIMVCLLGSFVVVGAESAVSNAAFRSLWLCCLGIVLSMSYTAIFGVKRSSITLLSCFSCICGSLCVFFFFVAMLTGLACGRRCPTAIIFNVFVLGILFSALRNSRILRLKIAEGVALTAAPQQEAEEARELPATRLGAAQEPEGAPAEPADVSVELPQT